MALQVSGMREHSGSDLATLGNPEGTNSAAGSVGGNRIGNLIKQTTDRVDRSG